jgi:hypothetical protein
MAFGEIDGAETRNTLTVLVVATEYTSASLPLSANDATHFCFTASRDVT